jgi:hypothetical protein
MFRVTTPQPGFTGESVGVQFVNGVGECPDGPALRYFRSQGYGVESVEDAAEPGEVEPQDSRPARNASTEAWRAYAVEHGLTADEATELTRDQLVELFTTEETKP